MTEVIAVLCGVIGALVTALGIMTKRLKNYSNGNITKGDDTIRKDFNAQVSLCSERFITLASNVGSITTSLANIIERQSKMDDKIDSLIKREWESHGKGH